MAISFTCPGCAKQFHQSDEAAGRTVRCKQCGEIFVVPTPARASRSAPRGEFPPVRGTTPASYHDPLPPPAPPRSSSTQRPVPAAYDDDPLPPPAPPRPQPRSGHALDQPAPAPAFDAYADLADDDDDGYSDPDDELPPLPAWVGGNSRTWQRKQKSLPIWAFLLPALIVGGGGALVLFLVLVVVPSMSNLKLPGGGGAGGAAAGFDPHVNGVLPGADLSGGANMTPAVASAGSGVGSNPEPGFPNLPPPYPNTYPAGQTVTNAATSPALRHDLIGQYLQRLRSMYQPVRDMIAAYRSVNSASDLQRAAPRIQQLGQMASQTKPEDLSAGLPSASSDEQREVLKQFLPEMQEVVDALSSELRRMERIPGVMVDKSRVEILIMQLKSQVEMSSFEASKPQFAPEGNQPYVEVYVRGVTDGETHKAIARTLLNNSDSGGGPTAGVDQRWRGSASSFRVWPVKDPQAFARKVFGSAGGDVRGHRIYATGWRPSSGS